ncbi:hypothetical protein [Bradyrhizobium sp. DASA03007]|uniref:hypothetical protein n=1 Tax=unclassified Bradyrhizobium TaxID=2631580 RepID=UPI003F7120D3
MKLHALAASAVTLALAFISPAEASNVNSDFVALATISYTVLMKCPDFEYIEGSGQLKADQMGADYDTYGPATVNAIFAIMGNEYDRTKLIPSVTQQVRNNLEELLGEIKKGDGYFCKKYGAVMLNVGFMKRK